MIEDDLRALLTDRAGTVADNPARVGAVHTRITGIRRRRSAGAALALVLIALAGLALTRLPGRPETLPTGSPGGPYFGDDGTSRSVDGYRGTSYFTFRGGADWSVAATFPGVRHVLVARCAGPGRPATGQSDGGRPGGFVLHCRVPVGGHYEGALPLDRTAYTRLVAAPVSQGANVTCGPVLRATGRSACSTSSSRTTSRPRTSPAR